MLRVLDDPAALARAAADDLLAGVRAAAAAGRVFSAALSGGTTPRALFALLADPAGPYRAALPWDALSVFWGDERFVPPDDPESNYRAAYQGLLSRVPLPPERVHRIPADLPDPEDAARRYEATLWAGLGPAVLRWHRPFSRGRSTVAPPRRLPDGRRRPWHSRPQPR